MIQSCYHEFMIKLRTMFALASCVAALDLLVACAPVAQSPFPTPLLPSTATAAPIPEATPEPTATANPPATSTAIAPTPSPIPLPTAAPPAAGWAWYENTAHAYRIVHPETWSVRSVTQPSGLIHQAIFTLVDEEPPVLPPEWQPYAERPTLAYSLVNADGYVEIEELFVQDGPCDVTPLTTHCQAWLQIYPTSSADR